MCVILKRLVLLSFFKTIRSSSYTFLRKKKKKTTTTMNNFLGNGHKKQVLCLSGSA